MALTKSFNELVQGRVARDPDFAATLLREGIDTMRTADVFTGKARSCSKATVDPARVGKTMAKLLGSTEK